MSLADELAADFEDELQEDAGSPARLPEALPEEAAADAAAAAEEADAPDAMQRAQERHGTNFNEVASVHDVAQLIRSRDLDAVRKGVREYVRTGEAVSFAKPGSMSVEEDPEYLLLVAANRIAMQLDDEMRIVYKYVLDHYSKRFAELERLVVNPFDYAQTVKALGNELHVSKDRLKHLPSATVMVVTVSATDSKGSPLPEAEMQAVVEACDLMFELQSLRAEMLEFVQSRISVVAPNVAAIIGTHASASLLSAAGGLNGLSKTPACNLPAMGARRQAQIGLATGASVRNHGFLYQSEIIQKVPPAFRVQAQRIVAAKLSLAARVDLVHESRDGAMGRRLRGQIEHRLEKVMEPPAQNAVKALPVPDERPKKRRAGRKVQRMRGQYAMTELRKQANRMAFGKQEEEVGWGDESEGLGMLGQSGSGSGAIRSAMIDARTKMKVGKTRRAQMQQMSQRLAGSSSVAPGAQTSGLASSLAFTPVQGLELVNPSLAQQRVKQANDKWFQSGIYSQIKRDPKATSLPGQDKK